MKKFIFIIAVSLFSIACKKDFLTLIPPSQATDAGFYKTPEDISNAVTAAYATLRGSSMYQDRFVTMMEARGDNVEDLNPGGNAGREYNIDRFLARADNVAVANAWEALYHAIFRCNSVLEHINVVTNATLKDQYEGEVKFLRALHYFNIVRLWGAAPLVLTKITTLESKSNVRNSPTEIYAAIENDLKDAIRMLPTGYANKVDWGRATQGAAKALLGKVYLTDKKYAQAVSVLKDLVPLNTNVYKYTLLPNVADVFSVANKMNAEIIFAVRYEKTLAGQGHGQSFYYNQPNLDPKLLAAYESADTRRDLLNTVTLDANNKPVKKQYDTFDPTTKQQGNDYVILRYADVLLMYAEALNEVAYSNDPAGEAFTYLNAVRSRANGSIYKPDVLTNQSLFRNAVLQERRLELPLELHRWFDLVRTGTAIDALRNSGLTPITIDANQYLYPIPVSQVELMNNELTFPQNLGYN